MMVMVMVLPSKASSIAKKAAIGTKNLGGSHH
jgi:hypothetical protein